MASFQPANGRPAAVDEASRQRQTLLGLNAYDRHKRFVNDLVTYYRGTNATSNSDLTGPQRTDLDVLRDGHRFIRSDKDDDSTGQAWEVRLAKRYYDRLYREYGLADLSRYTEGKIGLRWRTHAEVLSGKGQFTCGACGCEQRRGLVSFEVPFGYIEAGEKKRALVKVRVCPEHAYQLNHKKNKESEKMLRKRKAEQEEEDDDGVKGSRRPHGKLGSRSSIGGRIKEDLGNRKSSADGNTPSGVAFNGRIPRVNEDQELFAGLFE